MTTVREKKSCPTPRTFKRKISEDEDEAPPRKISVFSLGIGEEDEVRPRKISVFGLGIGEEDESPPSAIMNEDDLPALQELIVQPESPKPEPRKSPKRARPKSEPMESPERARPKLEAKGSPKRAKPEPEPTESPERPRPKLESTESPEQAKPEIELKKPPGCVKFGNVEVFKFHFTQGLDTVPSLENGTPLSLGMEEKHHTKYTFKVGEYANYKHNEKQFKYKQEGKIEENQSSQIHHQHNFFNRLDERYRRMLLIKEGVQIDEVVVNETRKLMKSREQCGCRCTGGRCRPETCECAKNGIECQIDVQDEDNITNNFPCICTVEGCQNPFGRIQLDQLRIRQHYTQTIMRIRAAKKLGSDWDDEKSSPQHTIFRDK